MVASSLWACTPDTHQANETKAKNAFPILDQGLVRQDLLAVTIQEQEIVYSEFKPYEAQEGDSISYHYRPHIKVLKTRKLWRDGQEIGFISGKDESYISTYEGIKGDTLENEAALFQKDAFELKDLTTGETMEIETVGRKSKIFTYNFPGGSPTFHHTIFVKSVKPFLADHSYALDFVKHPIARVVIDKKTINRYNQAIHVNHLGFTPNSQAKRAYLSLWAGDMGAIEYDQPSFSVYDVDNKKVVFTGKAKLAMAADGTEQLRFKKNYAKTEVWHLDFSEVTAEGNYKILLDDIGASKPFSIQKQNYKKGFEVVMRGFVNHRSGIELKSSFTDFVRPRCMHPDDGFKVYPTKFRSWITSFTITEPMLLSSKT